MNPSLLLRIICVGWAAIVNGMVFDAAGANITLPTSAVGKIEPGLWRTIDSGQALELLVLFGDARIDADMRAHLSQRRLLTEDNAARTLRAERYRQLKAPALAQFAAQEAEVRLNYRHIPMAFVRFNNAAALARLLARSEVVAVAEDIRLRPIVAQSLPLIGQNPVAQVMGRTGAGATVAVLDTGVDYTRSELGSCTSPGVPAGCRVVAALDFAPQDNALDADGHGTQVSGIIAATAPGASLVILDVFNGNSASSSDILNAMDWVIANRSTYNIVSINLSLGDDVRNTVPCSSFFTNPFRQPIIEAQTAGILTVVASGNEAYGNGLSNPACTPEAVSVGAVYDANVGAVGYAACSDVSSAADQVACFSNSASFLTLLAPGSLITTNGITTAGTSLAAPFVSAAVAVLAAAFPTDTPSQRLARLVSTGKPVLDARNGITKPRLDLLSAQGPPANNALAAAVTLSGTAGQTTGWNFNATPEGGEPNHVGVGGGKSVWWQWTAPGSGTLSLDTHGSSFNTVLAVYTGSAPNALTRIASNDDDGAPGNTSGLTLHVSPGVIYRIAVDGNAGAAGAITLSRTFSADPAGTDLSIVLSDTPDPVAAGAILTYTLTVTNGGTIAALDVTAILHLPASVSLVSSAGCTQSGVLVQCGLGTLLAGQQVIRAIQITSASGGTIQSQASVSSSTPDPLTANNTAIATTSVNAGAGGSADVPLPGWALLLLGAGLWRVMRWRMTASHGLSAY